MALAWITGICIHSRQEYCTLCVPVRIPSLA